MTQPLVVRNGAQGINDSDKSIVAESSAYAGVRQVDTKRLLRMELAGDADRTLGEVGINTSVAHRVGVRERVARALAANPHVTELLGLRALPPSVLWRSGPNRRIASVHDTHGLGARRVRCCAPGWLEARQQQRRQDARVVSFPIPLRYRMAYDAELTASVLRLFIGAVFSSYRRQAKKLRGVNAGRCGSVTFLQRFGDALNVNVHFHALVLDGVYIGESPHFLPLPAPTNAEIAGVAQKILRRLVRLLGRRGLTPEVDPTDADPLAGEEPLLAEIYSASVRGRVATGSRAGQPMVRLGDRIDAEDLEDWVQCAASLNFHGTPLRLTARHRNIARGRGAHRVAWPTC